jgi:hypothetical protein
VWEEYDTDWQNIKFRKLSSNENHSISGITLSAWFLFQAIDSKSIGIEFRGLTKTNE